MASNMTTANQTHPPGYTRAQGQGRDDWEDWEDEDDEVTPIDAGEQVFLDRPQQPAATNATVTTTATTTSVRTSIRTSKPTAQRVSRVSASKVNRVKSRKRQKAQNAKAGIRLITDMTTFRRPAQAVQLRTPDGRPVKFVDAAALRALEGSPTSASVGNWNWLKKNKTTEPEPEPEPESAATPRQVAASPNQALSPEDRPIVIGIALNDEEYNHQELSPPTAVSLDLITPINPSPSVGISPSAPAPSTNTKQTPTITRSMWSPDTPDTAHSFASSRVPSSIFSQIAPNSTGSSEHVPPVPAVPATYKQAPHQRLISLELKSAVEEDDMDTPCTLFEEDGVASPLKQRKRKNTLLTPDSAASKSNGWWDHVVTPFMDKRLTFASRKPKLDSPMEHHEDEWWSQQASSPKTAGVEVAANKSTVDTANTTNTSDSSDTKITYFVPKAAPGLGQTPIVRAPTPRRSPSPRIEPSAGTAGTESGPSTAQASPVHETWPVPDEQQQREKPHIIVTPVLPDQPPPYSPPKKLKKERVVAAAVPVRYRAVFPPGHPLQAQFPPSPGPESPGLAATMTSQGATPMTEIPLTPAAIQTRSPLSQIVLPNRPVGTYLPQEHSHDARGDQFRVERMRRRHEKEEVVARKLGGCWRGRGCIPEKGCFGRSGREGRKRRRICCLILIIILLLIILAIVLSVVLTRPHHAKDIPNIWVNLTDFPPMPTGVLSVVGPDNSVAVSGCTEPSTLWSCYIPKDQQDSVSPYGANQPTVILDIQYDNGTAQSWNVSNGEAPDPVPRSLDDGLWERDSAFSPNPSAPTYKEMWFLGNTTDGVVADEKAGEPTPFYITLVSQAQALDSGELTVVSKRSSNDTDGDSGITVNLTDVLPSPSLNTDGTPKPAVLLPQPIQQPVRLYDRGLPTERYSFYTYFERTIFLKSVTVVNSTNADGDDNGNVPLDEDGGCAETEANFLVTWSQTRLLVEIWTKTLEANTSVLLSSEGQKSINGSAELIRPGTMPYPVTVKLDTHGGDPTEKFVWEWPMDDRQDLDLDDPKLLANNIGFNGTWINKRSTGSSKYGGFDGGTGGCKCEWVNFQASG